MQRQNQKTIGASRTMMINPCASLAGVDAANGQCWYEIRALSAGRVEIFLYDVIGGWGITAQQFVADCKEAGCLTPARWIYISTAPVAMSCRDLPSTTPCRG